VNSFPILFKEKRSIFGQSTIIQIVKKFPVTNTEVTIKPATEGNSESAQFSPQHHNLFLYNPFLYNRYTVYTFVPQIVSSLHVGLL
jgi:hypothetical protein